MRVCVIGTRGFPQIEGGVEKHCESLYTSMEKDIEMIVFRRKAYVKSDIHYEGIRFIDLPSTKIRGVETVIHSFLASLYAIAIHPDIVHYHNIGPALFAPLIKLCGIGIVLTYHSPNYEHKKWGGFAKRLLKFSEKVAFRCADKIIFVNRFQMEKNQRSIRQRSVYIPNGISTPNLTKKLDHLDALSLEAGRYILSVGRITPEKGFDTLIRGFKAAKLQGYKLVIAGGVEFENGYMQELKGLCEDAQVTFTGYVYGETLAQLYKNAVMYVLSSRNEGFPLVLLEAMSYGLDILVSDIPAAHLVDLDVEDYFPEGDYIALGKKIRTKLDGCKKRTYDLSAFDWGWIAGQVEAIYKELGDKE